MREGSGVAGSSGSKGLGRRLSERLTGFAYQLGWKLICRIPESWARWVFTKVADIAWRRQGPKVQVLEANLHRVLSYQQESPDVEARSCGPCPVPRCAPTPGTGWRCYGCR